MRDRRNKINFEILLTILFVTLIFVGSGYAGDNKFSPKALSVLNTSPQQEVIKYWVYLDESAFDKSNLVLTERSLARRAKVDPVNFLIDEKDYAVKDEILNQLRNTGLQIRHEIRWFGAVSVEADYQQIQSVSKIPSVKNIDLVKSYKRAIRDSVISIKDDVLDNKALSTDYGFSKFQIEFIRADVLHRAGLTGKGVRIAMFDTGFNIFHSAFASTDIVGFYDFINNDSTVHEKDCDSAATGDHQSFHGTATFGVVGANSPDTIMGVAFGAEFLLAKTEISCYGTEIKIEEDNWIAAAQWADVFGADIISSSLGYADFQDNGSYTVEDLDGNTALITIAADIAASKNILVVNSAGNERLRSWGTIITPADGDSVIAVGAVGSDSNLAGFSSPGPSADGRIKPDITTLGVGVYSASHLGGLSRLSGTSFSAPLVAAGAALALEHDPTMTAAELADLIRQSGDRYENPDNDYGHGLFDAVKTADIIKIEPPFDYTVKSSGEILKIITSGRTDSIAALTAINLPEGIIFRDNGDGTGDLEIENINLLEAVSNLKIVADVGYFVDTSEFTIIKDQIFGSLISFGPNPFSDSLNIYFDNSVEKLKSLAIYSMNGEIVWEKVNNFTEFTDVIIEQWNGLNQSGKDVAAGVYLLLVVTDRQQFHYKLLKVDT